MAYHYWSDPRLDPWDNADDFNAFIQAVKKATGHKKVSIDARCLGTTTVMSYMVKYGRANNFEDISTCIFYNGTMNGIAMAGKLFAGNLHIDAEGVGRFATDYLAASAIEEVIGSTVTLAQEVGLVNVGTDIVDYIFQKVYKNALPRILKGTYGSTYGYWSMVSDEYFEDAIALNYSQQEQEGEYKDFIAKLRNYHYNVQLKNFDTLKMMKDCGVNVAVIAKYGYQVVPVAENSDQMGDNRIDLYDQSFGATSAPVSKTFTDEYIASVAPEKRKYIAPDKQVDASTCVLPENTWFIKNIDHIDFPACVDVLMMKILRSKEQVTINSFPEYPQFLLYTGETEYRKGDGKIVPLTADNGNTQQKYKEDKESAFVEWIKSFIKLALDFIDNIFAKIKALFS